MDKSISVALIPVISHLFHDLFHLVGVNVLNNAAVDQVMRNIYMIHINRYIFHRFTTEASRLVLIYFVIKWKYGG